MVVKKASVLNSLIKCTKNIFKKDRNTK
jgi:hypothetical protein